MEKGKSRCQLNVLCQQQVPRVKPIYSVAPGKNDLTTGHHTWVGTVLVYGKSFSSDAESSKPKARESAAQAALTELIGVVDIGLEEVDTKCELLLELRAVEVEGRDSAMVEGRDCAMVEGGDCAVVEQVEGGDCAVVEQVERGDSAVVVEEMAEEVSTKKMELEDFLDFFGLLDCFVLFQKQFFYMGWPI